MIKVGDILVSDDIADKEFVCNLEKCKGACCVEGDYGAPLEEDELEILKMVYYSHFFSFSDSSTKFSAFCRQTYLRLSGT